MSTEIGYITRMDKKNAQIIIRQQEFVDFGFSFIRMMSAHHIKTKDLNHGVQEQILLNTLKVAKMVNFDMVALH